MAGDPVNLLGLPRAELEAFVAERLGAKPFRARQLMKWIYRRGAADFSAMTRSGAGVSRRSSREVATIAVPEIVDGAAIDRRHAQMDAAHGRGAGHRDGVHPRARPRHAVHLEPGRLRHGLHVLLDRAAGLQPQPERRRDRRPGVAGAPRTARTTRPDGRAITNIVFMGMGEPLANYRNVVPAMRIFLDDLGYDLSRRRVTLSTSGLVPQIYKLAEECNVALAVSLHAPERRVAQPARAHQPQASDRGAARGVLALHRQAERPQRHVRVRHARRRQRQARACAGAGAAVARPSGETQFDSVQRVSGYALSMLSARHDSCGSATS